MCGIKFAVVFIGRLEASPNKNPYHNDSMENYNEIGATVELQWLKFWWLIHLGCLVLSSWSLYVILCQNQHGKLELPLARTIFHGPKPVQAIEVLLYL